MIRMAWDDDIEDAVGKGGYVPRFACDTCGELITNGLDGVAIWVVPEAGVHVIQPVYHVHRGECDDGFRKRFEVGGRLTYWEGLLEHTLHLANNAAPQGRGPSAELLITLTEHHPLHDRYK